VKIEGEAAKILTRMKREVEQEIVGGKALAEQISTFALAENEELN